MPFPSHVSLIQLLYARSLPRQVSQSPDEKANYLGQLLLLNYATFIERYYAVKKMVAKVMEKLQNLLSLCVRRLITAGYNLCGFEGDLLKSFCE